MNLTIAQRASAVLYAFLEVAVADKPVRHFLLPANICPAVPLTFCKLRIPFQFYDIDAETLLPDEQSLIERIGSSQPTVGGLLYSGTLGFLPDTTNLYRWLKSAVPDLLIIEDRCLHRPQFETTALPSGADLALYSTGYGKYADIGYGGFGFSKLGFDLPAGAPAASQPSWKQLEADVKTASRGPERYQYTDCDWLDLSIPSQKLTEFSSAVQAEAQKMDGHKTALNSIYAEAFPAECCLRPEFQSWRFTILLEDPLPVQAALFEAGLFASRHFQPLDGIFSDEETCPNARVLHRKALNLFNDRYYSNEQALRTVDVVRKAAGF